MPSYPRETNEFQPVKVTLEGSPMTDPNRVQVAITAKNERPTIWTTPAVLGDEFGVTISGLAPGLYIVWARVTDTAESPVIKAGTIRIT